MYDRYSVFFESTDNQFEFKKNLGCANAVYVILCIAICVSFGTTVNICAVDLSKAFDKNEPPWPFLLLN